MDPSLASSSESNSILPTLAALVAGQLEPTQLPTSAFPDLISAAREHAVAPMLYWRLHSAGFDLKTQEWYDLRRLYTQQVYRYLQRKSAYKTLETAFHAAHIPTIWLKGFALAHSVYPNPALRPMADMDVLVPFSNKEQALALALQHGYVIVPLQSPARQIIWHHYQLRGPVILEMHYRLLSARSKSLRSAQLTWFWSQTQLLRCSGISFHAFTPEAEILYLSAHAILQHGETEFLLQRYLDLHLLIQQTPALDWNLIVEQAIQLCCTYPTQRALTITRDYFHSPIPDAVLDALEQRRPREEGSVYTLQIQPDSTLLESTLELMRAMSGREKWGWFWGILFPTAAYISFRYRPRAAWQLPFYYPYRWLSIASDSLRTMLKWLHLVRR